MDKLLDYEVRHIDLMRSLAPECAVLLKKDGSFPLEGPCDLALYGSGARRTVKGGTGSGDVNSRFYVTCEGGLRHVGFNITTGEWLDGFDRVMEDAKARFIAQVKEEARRTHQNAILLGMGKVMPEPEYELPISAKGDTAIYVLARNSGEGSDRQDQPGDYRLTRTEVRDILYCAKKYKRFMLVLNVGGPVDLTPVLGVGNILLLSQLGVVTGAVLADIVLGKSYPSGKLAATWAAAGDIRCAGDFGDPDETRYREGVYVGYKYYEAAGIRPIFPFGFGLGWTEFTIGSVSVELDGADVTVNVPVFNSGRAPGRETVQVYVSAPWGELDQPRKTLAGFGKTGELGPGEAQTVSVGFGLGDIASWDAKTASWVLEPGRYTVRAGTSSDSTSVCAVIDIPERVVVRRCKNVGGKPDFTDWRPEPPREEAIPESVPVLTVTPETIQAIKDACGSAAEREQFPTAKSIERARRLSDRDLIYMCHGRFKEGGGMTGIIGGASQTVAGAAGETCSRDGAPGLVMADGPAGLRLAVSYVRDKDGARDVTGAMPAGLDDFAGGLMKLIMKLGSRKPKGEIFHQYCTAIPIGTALAQSWDRDLVRKVGEAVGEEMERFGVHLWLAPAMNIQRNPLCGRNFEYYSEDPLVSGEMAAAMTRGVQSRPGRGVTIKHFCCNNQENNRYANDSMVSERVLREVYLRGFGICVTRSDPAAVMTSYNLLNGVHTSEREDLSRDILREEWGFRGLIMTDWVMSMMKIKGRNRVALSAPTLAAGNIFMPGSSDDAQQAMEALKSGQLDREKAAACAAQVFDAVARLRGGN